MNFLHHYENFIDVHWRGLLLTLSVLGLLACFCRKETLTEPIASLCQAGGLILLAFALSVSWAFGSNAVLALLGHSSTVESAEDCLLIGIFGAVLATTLFSRLFHLGDLICDVLYSEGSYADDTRMKELPELKALHLHRRHGYARKTYGIARRYLWNDERAYGHWLFTAETAACYLRDFGTARRIVNRLCRSSAFTRDQKVFAIQNYRRWRANSKATRSVAVPA